VACEPRHAPDIYYPGELQLVVRWDQPPRFPPWYFSYDDEASQATSSDPSSNSEPQR
jgi:hypothetical protein